MFYTSLLLDPFWSDEIVYTSSLPSKPLVRFRGNPLRDLTQVNLDCERTMVALTGSVLSVSSGSRSGS